MTKETAQSRIVTTLELRPIGSEKSPDPASLYVPTFQEIGYISWKNQLPHRTDSEVRAVYDPNNPSKAKEQQRIIENLGSRGTYLAAVLKEEAVTPAPITTEGQPLTSANESRVVTGETIVGFAAMINDVSGNAFERFYKTFVQRRQPYGKISIVNVHPDYQRRGIGARLVQGLIQSREGKKLYQPTAYVFDENQVALQFFKKLGFKRDPIDQQSQLKYDYFGPGTAAARQWRLSAPNNKHVISNINSHFKFPEEPKVVLLPKP